MLQASSARLNSRSAAVICTLARSVSWLLFRIVRRTSMVWRLSVGLGARERGALAFIFIGEGGAFDHAQYVAGLHGVAGAHLIDDGAGRFGEQGGAHGGHHHAGGRHVAHEGSAFHHRGAQPVARDDFLG